MAYSDLQDALAEATAGDEIRVAAGTYTPAAPGSPRSATLGLISGVALRGGYAGFDAADPDARDIRAYETILSGDLVGDDGPGFANRDDNSYHVVTAVGVDETAVLDGFTVTGGNADGSSDDSGGGIYCRDGSPIIIHCTIRTNSAASRGGGVFCDSSNATITRCTISDNRVLSAEPEARAAGGGLHCVASEPTILQCLIRGNVATSTRDAHEAFGGGVYCQSSRPRVSNTTIIGNSANPDPADGLGFGRGGGLYCASSSPILTNCTIRNNTARGSHAYGGGVYCDYASRPEITNSILWGDRPAEVYAAGGAVVQFSNMEGGLPGEGNISADPLFATGDTGLLLPGSPCINGGTNEPPGGLAVIDALGNPRLVDGQVDIGSIEYNAQNPTLSLSISTLIFAASRERPKPDPQRLLVRSCGRGSVRWEVVQTSPWLSVQPGAGECRGDDMEVEVALAVDASGMEFGEHRAVLSFNDPSTGTSRGQVNVLLRVGSTLLVPSQYATIQAGIDAALEGDVVLVADGDYGGPGNNNLYFGGKNITVRSENGPVRCAIHCAYSLVGFDFHSGETGAAVVEGFTITSGRSGVWCRSNSNPTIRNCVITGHAATPTRRGQPPGAGIRCEGSHPTIMDCRIFGNVAESTQVAGGISCASGSDPMISRCRITENRGLDAGGVSCSASSPSIENSVIARNAASKGAGVACYSASAPVLTNSTIAENQAANFGGGIYCDSASSAPVFTNSILWDNWPNEVHGGSPVIGYSDVEGSFSGTGNIDDLPVFSPVDGDYHLRPGSPCVDVGTNGPSGGLPPTDADGNPRVLPPGGTADMGAYELPPTAPQFAASRTNVVVNQCSALLSIEERTIQLYNVGSGTLTWGATDDADWLTVIPTNGVSDGEPDDVVFRISPGGLAAGTYVSTVGFSDPTAINDPFVIEVTLRIHDPRRVPSVYPTIQAAIDAAAWANDTVLVADGVYTGPGNKDLDFGGKSITVRSENGPAQCVIDCEGDGRGFEFHNRETSAAVVEGFTITHGDAPGGGGGMNCAASSPTIINCVLINNFRGGLANYGSNPALINCSFLGNVDGNAVYNEISNPVLVNCEFSGNSYGSWGAGVYNDYNSHATLINCTFTQNHAIGLYGEDGSSSTIVNCIFWGNWDSESKSEQTQLTGGTLAVSHSCIQGLDTLAGHGNIGERPWFVDVDGPDDIPGTADDDLRQWPGSPCIDAGTNGALPPDTADLDRDGNTTEPIPFDRHGLTRRIKDGDRDGLAVVDMGAYEFPTGDCNGNGVLDLQDIIAGTSGDCTGDGVPDECDPDCNGNGVPDSCDLLAGTGSDANSNGVIDDCEVVFVDGDAVGRSSGTSWADAYTDLQDALTAARSANGVIKEIWVAAAAELYRAAGDSGDPTISFELVNGVALYGGFAGGESALDQRDWAANETVLSGDLGPGHIDRSNHVLVAKETVPSAVLDGFVVTGGHASGGSNDPTGYGAGMYIDRGYATIRNCVFRGNLASAAAGIYNTSDDSHALLYRCEFRENHSFLLGGGMYNDNGARATLIECDFIDNNAGSAGGGLLNARSSQSTLLNCRFLRNSAGRGDTPSTAGGGMHNSESSAFLVNCAFVGNRATSGAGMSSAGFDCQPFCGPLLLNCVFVGNSAASTLGGGIYGSGFALSMGLENCVLWGNSAAGFEDQWAQIYIGTSYSDYVVVNHTCLQAWSGSLGGLGNFGDDPLFVDAAGPDGTYGTTDDNLRLRPTSPCIDAGSDATLPLDDSDLDGDGDTSELIPWDLARDPRVVDGDGDGNVAVDVGAYEYQADCNTNGIFDPLDIAGATSQDCNTNGVPDECEICGDLDGDWDVDADDFNAFLHAFGSAVGDSRYIPCTDYNESGVVGMTDYQQWLQCYRDFVGDASAAPPVGTLGDFDADGDIDLADSAWFQGCLPAPPERSFACSVKFDFNEDSQVDLLDWAEFQAAVTGP